MNNNTFEKLKERVRADLRPYYKSSRESIRANVAADLYDFYNILKSPLGKKYTDSEYMTRALGLKPYNFSLIISPDATRPCGYGVHLVDHEQPGQIVADRLAAEAEEFKKINN
jgi:hypothetical protein